MSIKPVRYVAIDRDRPYAVPPQPHTVWICGCGLSKNKPYCDGSHVQLSTELLSDGNAAADETDSSLPPGVSET